MGAIKRRMEDKSELALMGKFVPVDSDEEAIFITNYILTVLNHEDLLEEDLFKDHIRKYNQNNTVKYVGTNTIEGMVCITYCLSNGDVPNPFETDYGSGNPASFCYVFNLVDTFSSSFGDCFFEKRSDRYYHRVN